jgi:hypothetical protein
VRVVRRSFLVSEFFPGGGDVEDFHVLNVITCNPISNINSDIPVNRMIARSDLNNTMVRICVCTIPGTVLVHIIKLMYIIYNINLLCLVVMVYLYIDSIYSIFFPLLLVTRYCTPVCTFFTTSKTLLLLVLL